MNQRTAKLIRRYARTSTEPSSLYRKQKKLWNRCPRLERGRLRAELKAQSQ